MGSGNHYCKDFGSKFSRVLYWRAKETLEEAVRKKELMKNRYKNPRRGYVNDGQGIGTDYSRWLEKKLFVFPFQIIP